MIMGKNTVFFYIILAYDKTTYIHFLGYIHKCLVLEENKVYPPLTSLA